jgi:demethylmenaquinone methyltransferase / 2-methoxy-6-polyprenyl-1,4-benzoquinol methylase
VDRRRALRALFQGIAPTYDRLNRILSLGIDRGWRSRAAREAVTRSEQGLILDLASGTGDQALALRRHAPGATVLRLDLSAGLLSRGSGKLSAARLRPTIPAPAAAGWGSGSAEQAPADAAPAVVAEMERLPVRAGSCIAVTMAFALRHVESLESLMKACAAVLEPGGRVSLVDMALPERGVWAAPYRFYFTRCLPVIAQLVGGDREAYELMVRSVASFPGWDALERAARVAGFEEIRVIPLTGGAARVFVARVGGGARLPR